MTTKIINKRTDSSVFKLRKIRDGRDHSLVFCEGEKLIEDLFRSRWQCVALYCIPQQEKNAENLRSRYQKTSVPIMLLSHSVMKFCSDLTTPPGLIAVAKPSKVLFSSDASSNSASFFLVLHGVQLPQNVGALIRTAEAAGVTKIFTTPSTAAAFGPKALRGSAGSAFRVSVERQGSLEAVLKELRSQNVRAVAATQRGRTFYDQINWKQPIALVVGSEGSGFSAEEMRDFDETIKIPMHGDVESLNVGSAAAACLFEAARQRRLP